MRRLLLIAWMMSVVLFTGTATALWVPRDDSLESFYPYPTAYEGSGSGFTWVEVPQPPMPVAIDASSSNVEAPDPGKPHTEARTDIEYENLTATGDFRANVVEIRGSYQVFPDFSRAYGLRFYNEFTKGWGNPGNFTMAPFYRRFIGGSQEINGMINLSFLTGGFSGVMTGPACMYLYKTALGPLSAMAGVSGGVSIIFADGFRGSDRFAFSYAGIVSAGMPLTPAVALNLEGSGSHRYAAAGVQLPLALARGITVIPGVRKTFIFNSDAQSNIQITLGASRPF